MKRHRIFLAGLLALTLGFGLWVSAVDLQPTLSSFTEGDIVTASDFNDLFTTIDQNFSDVETAINTLEETKVGLAGDIMTGPLGIAFDGDGDDIGLLIKKTGGGPLMIAMNEDTGQGLQVNADGSLLIGTSGSPEITLDVTTGDATLTGTVRNTDGDNLLPIAYGHIAYNAGDADVLAGSANVTSATFNYRANRFEVALTGVDFDHRRYVTVATVQDGEAMARVSSFDGVLFVYTFDTSGWPTSSDFSFVVFDPED